MARERVGYEELGLGKLSFVGECPLKLISGLKG